MKSTIRILGGALLLFFNSNSNAQSYQWYRSVKSEGFDEAYDLATDNLGNVYVAGMIEYEADFGNGVILESVGVHDIFIAKYDSIGNLIWAKRAGGRDGDKVQSIALDNQGYLYVAGEFEDTSSWESIQIIAQGGNNMFVARYDTSGHVQWVRSLGTNSTSHTRGYGVTADSHSNVYVAGGTLGDTYYQGNYLYTSAGDYDGTLTSFDKNGNFRWSLKMGGTDSDKARGVVSDQGSNIYVTGYFSGNADFSGTVLHGRGHSDVFLAKYDTSGIMQWATLAGDTGFDRSWDVDINVNGQILVAGDESRGRFDANIASCQGMTDAFVAAYDASGNNLWVTAGGGGEADEGRGVAHDASGNIFLVGDYGGSAIFPPVTFTGNHYAEPFIASYLPNGSALRWVRNGSGPSNDRGTGVGTDPSGNIFICGNFEDSLQVGNFEIPGDSLLDIYVTRLSSQNICSSNASITGNINCFGMCNGTATVTASGQSPFSYTWNTVPVQHTQTITGLCAGNYSVTVTDAMGCVSTTSILLDNPPQLVVNTSSTSISCFGQCDGTADAAVTGQSPFTYSWNTTPVQTTETAVGLCSGSYTVTVTDVAGCIQTADITLTDPVQLQVASSTTAITCFGDCDGTANATATGASPFTYSWNTVPVQTTETATGLCDGNYVVTVTDASGCSTTSSVTLNNPPQLLINPAVTAVTCHGDCDGIADARVSGRPPFTFSWNTVQVQTTQTASNLCAGNYTVTVTDSAGCTSSSQVLITEPFVLSLTGIVSDATCTGCSDGSINITPGGGTPPYQYAWSNGESTEDIQNLSTGHYNLCITDANLCTTCDSFVVYDPSTGITALTGDNFSVSPNPFTSSIKIHSTVLQKGGTQIRLFNALGEIIFRSEFFGNDDEISTRELTDGIYFLELSVGIQRKILPLIKSEN